LSALSFFDLLGSGAYSLTSLPTPESDHLFGAKGNEQTCTAQGFFIQIGTIACFLNVSLALYYLLTIKYGWTEERFKKKYVAGFLFAPPIVIGLVFAFVGIPYYDNVRVWCNNSAKQVHVYSIDSTGHFNTAIIDDLCFSFLFQMVTRDSSHLRNHCSYWHHGNIMLPRLHK